MEFFLSSRSYVAHRDALENAAYGASRVFECTCLPTLAHRVYGAAGPGVNRPCDPFS